MKIILCHKDIKAGGGRGGICTLYNNLAEELSALGAKVTTVSSWKQQLRNSQIKHICLNYRNDPKDYRIQLANLLKNLDFDVAECSSWKAELLEYAKLKNHKPIIVRGDLSACFFNNYSEAKAEKELLEKADYRLAVSKDCARELEKIFGIKIDKVILNGVDSKIYQPNLKIKQKKKDKIHIVWVGKPVFSKGYDLLNKIIAESPPNFIFHIVLGHAQKDCEIKLNASKKVKFYQDISETDLVKLYNQCDVCLSTSRYEGFGLAILEAMACGTPVIIPRQVAAFSEFVRDDIDGYTYDDINEINGLIRKAGGLNKKFISKRAKEFIWKKTAEETLAVYKKILKLCVA